MWVLALAAEVVEEHAADAAGLVAVREEEVLVAPGLEARMERRVVTVASLAVDAVEVTSVLFEEIVRRQVGAAAADEHQHVQVARAGRDRRGLSGGDQRGVAVGPQDSDAVYTDLQKNDVKVTYTEDDANPILTTALTILLPMLFLLVMFYLFMRQLQAGGGKAMSFGKSKAKLLTDSQNRITFKDVAGAEEAKDAVDSL